MPFVESKDLYPLNKIPDGYGYNDDTLFLFECECCHKTLVATVQGGYEAGYDSMFMYGPKMLSPRHCKDCSITSTLWWKVCCNGIKMEDLTEHDLIELKKILLEPESRVYRKQEENERERNYK